MTNVQLCVGMMVTFWNMGYDEMGFQNRCAMMTVYPFGIIILANMMFDQDMIDRNVIAWDRHRGLPYFPPVAFFSSALADLFIVKIMPPVITTIFTYYPCNLNRNWYSFGSFFSAWMALHFVGGCISRFFVTFVAHSSKVAPTQIALSYIATQCCMVLYAGFILNLGSLPSSKFFIRDFSIYYWVCNIKLHSCIIVLITMHYYVYI